LFPVGGLLKTTTQIETVSKNGDKIFCIKVITGEDGEANGIPLSFVDCGDAQTHVKITGLTPRSAHIGRKVTITGTGTLDKDITGGTYHMQTFYSGGNLLDCSGDASASKKCSLLGGLLGSITFDGLSFPVKKGTTSVSVDLSLSSGIPAGLARTATKVTATTKSGDQAFCIEVFTAPANAPANELLTNSSMYAPSEETTAPVSSSSLSQEAAEPVSSNGLTCVALGQPCDPNAILPWKHCCQGFLGKQFPKKCCDLGPDGVMCAFAEECPQKSLPFLAVRV